MKSKSDSHGFFEAYQEYAKVLRTWLVAYGIGAPVVFLTNEGLSKAILHSPEAKLIAGFFLAGVALQIVIAALNKHCMWVLYYGETEKDFQNNPAYKCAEWLSDHISIDLIVDLVTILLFAIATWWAYSTLVLK